MEEVQTVKLVVQDALESFDQKQFIYGDFLTFQYLYELLKIDPDAKDCQLQFVSKFERFRDRLLIDKNLALNNVFGKGYYIVKPQKQAEVAYHQSMRLMDRAFRRADKTLRFARLNEMDYRQRREHEEIRNKMTSIEFLAKKSAKNIKFEHEFDK